MPNRWDVTIISPDGQTHEFKNMTSAGKLIGVGADTVHRYGHGFKQGMYGGYKIILKDPFATKKKKSELKGDVYSRIRERRIELQSQTK